MALHVDVMYDVKDVIVWRFLSKIVCGAKNIKTYIYNVTKIYYQWNVWWKVTEIVTSHSLIRSRVIEFYINSLITFELLELEYGDNINTNINPVSFALKEIQKVTEIVTSQSLSRSRVSSA